MIKRICASLLMLAMVLTLCACGKSEAAQAVDDQIAAIGEVTLYSGGRIAAAEKAVAALEEKDVKRLDNAALLEQARTAYDTLVAEEEQRKQEEARRILEEKAAVVDAAIDAIGAVTLNSGEAILAARTAYDESEADVQALVAGLSDLEAAEITLSELRAEEVALLIDQIGEEVTLETGDRVDAAQKAMYALTADDAARVRNADVLQSAADTLKALRRERAEKLLPQCRDVGDKVRNYHFYYPMELPYYTSYGYWGADIRSFVLPYIGRQGDYVWLRLICNYTGRDWVFFEKITFAVDDARYYKRFNYFEVTRDNNAKVWEYVDLAASDDDIALLKAIADSKETIVRFEGDDYYTDFTVSQKDKDAIRRMLEIYEGLR